MPGDRPVFLNVFIKEDAADRNHFRRDEAADECGVRKAGEEF